VKLENAGRIAGSGIEYLCVGSALLKAEDPILAYQSFLRIIHE